MNVLINIEAASGKPIYRQIVDEIVEAIASGYLKGGEKLPSTRDLGKALGISRFTVMRSYEDLASAGYIKIATGSGAYVSDDVRDGRQNSGGKETSMDLPPIEWQKREPALSHSGAQALRSAGFAAGAPSTHAALNHGLTDIDLLPLNRWKEVFYTACRDVQTKNHTVELRAVLVEYLSRARRVRATADRLMTFASWQNAYDFVLRLLVDPGDNCAIESPGRIDLYRTMLATGASVHPVNMDGHGMSARHLDAIEGELKLICVNSGRHEPTGLTMTAERRQEILAVAERRNAYVLENDRNHEFRYGQKREPSMQGMDTQDLVIYIGTTADVMAPLNSLAYIVLPEHLLEAATALKAVVGDDRAPIDELALAHFIVAGHYERHIKRTAEIYAERRAALVHALTTRFGDQVKIVSAGGGTNLVVRFGGNVKPIDIELASAQLSLPLVSSGCFYPLAAESDNCLVGFGQHSKEQLSEAVSALAAYISDRQAEKSVEALALPLSPLSFTNNLV